MVADAQAPRRGWLIRNALLSTLALAAANASAASFEVSPVRIQLSPAEPIGVLQISNDGDTPVTVQLEPKRWSQTGGDDVYAGTRDLLATPPIFTLPAAGTQLVRIGLRVAPPPASEASYRIFLQQVPAAPAPGFRGLQVLLRIGIPVFVKPGGPVQPRLQWTAHAGTGGKLLVAAQNLGSAHVQVVSLSVSAGRSGKPLAQQSLSAYVLPGRRRQWTLKADPLPKAGTMLHLRAQTDAGELSGDAALQP
ncbi:MAG: molecular chaperone [Gammaproteobacteria bacterium]|nr:molecular chaperone [Gammaproteobacteria bacterium]